MLTFFLRCPNCAHGVSPASFPLCESCRKSLFHCPVLCPQCASPVCSGLTNEACKRPWVVNTEIRSFTARYLLLEPGYSVLRKWKVRGGPAFDRQILNFGRDLKEFLARKEITKIIPMPQSFERSLELGGSPAERIAVKLSQDLGVPWEAALFTERNTGFRQAQLSVTERLKSAKVFHLEADRISARDTVLLVDDFMTSGQTIRRAVRTLRRWEVRDVHVFCLGIRPFMRFNHP